MDSGAGPSLGSAPITYLSSIGHPCCAVALTSRAPSDSGSGTSQWDPGKLMHDPSEAMARCTAPARRPLYCVLRPHPSPQAPWYHQFTDEAHAALLHSSAQTQTQSCPKTQVPTVDVLRRGRLRIMLQSATSLRAVPSRALLFSFSAWVSLTCRVTLASALLTFNYRALLLVQELGLTSCFGFSRALTTLTLREI